ncbi:hypothetical protein [Microvirga flavescens]|uniref:hypothetical protein n=1 Tax=Microvirga flavescens TaxID=2249811 RepID=UPI000DDA0D75|nr:hypothetical protein [Microvirga flavescens]
MPATHIRFGNETQVNDITAGHQSYNYVTALVDGGWVVTWTTRGNMADIVQQRYDADGMKVGTEAIVNTHTTDLQYMSVATGLVDGGWVVAWVSSGQDGSSEGVYQQRYDSNGAKAGAETRVNVVAGGYQGQPSIAPMADGGWIVTYLSELNGILQQRFDAAGAAVGTATRVDDDPPASMYSSAALTTFGWVVAWTGTDGARDNIFQQAFDLDGNKLGTPQQVNVSSTGQQRDAHVMGLLDGGWVVFWSSDTGESQDLYQQRYDAAGAKVGGETLVNADARASRSKVQSTLLSDGNYVVTWTAYGYGPDGDEGGIYQQVFSASGDKIGAEILVNVTTVGSQNSATVTALANGGWVVSWDSNFQDGDGYGIYQRVFSPSDDLTLRPGTDFVIGTNGNDTFQVASGGLDAGDEVHGGDGFDTLQLAEAGTLDLRNGAISGIEVLRGSEGDDTFILKSGLNTGFSVINGEGGSNDVVQVQAGATDLSTATISGIEKIRFAAAGSAVRFNFWDHAKLVQGTNTEGVTDEVIFAIDIVTNARILQLFRQGIDKVTDSNGVSYGIIPIELTNAGGTTRTTVDVPVKPFATGLSLSVAYGAEATATVKLDDPAKGKFIPSNLGGTYNATSGTFTIKGSADAVEKAIEALSFDPADGGNVGGSSTTTFTVTITDGFTTATDSATAVESTVANLAPDSINLSNATVLENSAAGTVVATLSATDPNAPETFTFDIIGDAAGRFAVSGNTLIVKDGVRLDYEQATSHEIILRVKDVLGLVRDEAFKIQVGDVANEIATGTMGNDVLKGGAGKDRFYGGLGNDTLEGGKGQDIFVFDTKPNKKTNIDTITDFSVKDDGIWLDNAIFKKLGKAGSEKKPAMLSKNCFTIGTKAADAKNYLIYNKKTGALYYDADGTGAQAQIQIATLSKNLKMTYKDFFVI